MANGQSQEEVPPPLQDIPTAKEKKYDRQLRLWGAAGQIALEQTHILLINNGSGVTGVETLKNLVLPGIGQFSILDSAIVSEADLGVNFFLDDASLGKYRAEETVKLLRELNDDVDGHAITAPLETWITSDDALTPYTLVLIAAPLDPRITSIVQSHAHALNIPLFFIHSIGYYSHFSVALPAAFPIVDTHPDPTATTDLRLLKPWPALLEFAVDKCRNMDKMNGEEFAHIPYVCLLLYYLEQWKATHGGKLPTEYKEKTAFRDLVRSGSATEENFDEACAAVLKSLNDPKPPSSVIDILTAQEAQQLTATSDPFWVIASAIRQFVDKHGELPLPGAVPDMKARSNDYIQLQNVYKAKARQDASEVLATVRAIEHQTGRSAKQAIDEKEIENFCKGAAHIALVRGSPIKIANPPAKIALGAERAKALRQQCTSSESLLHVYLSFLAWDEFVATHSSGAEEAGGMDVGVPGAGAAPDFGADADKITGIAEHFLDDMIKEANSFLEEPHYSRIKSKIAETCKELARAGGAELHNIASLTGGMVAQEVIKVITKQYVPINNTCVFDGITSRSQVLLA